ncbi:MAG: type II toxin-antitoxin system Phd/YefM family antitoxin [Hydrococcus sp. C42_A2020_068]|nr:type II toxin-antitoxin system Phd/YefM family antitoxin [Hydrococcus sp. C42_A2020_068]
MLDIARDINSLSNFKRNTAEFMQQLKQTGAPIVLTVNGVSEIVVQSVEAYQKLLDRIEHLETLEGIRKGLDEKARGEGKPALEALEELRSELNIPRGE